MSDFKWYWHLVPENTEELLLEKKMFVAVCTEYITFDVNKNEVGCYFFFFLTQDKSADSCRVQYFCPLTWSLIVCHISYALV